MEEERNRAGATQLRARHIAQEEHANKNARRRRRSESTDQEMFVMVGGEKHLVDVAAGLVLEDERRVLERVVWELLRVVDLQGTRAGQCTQTRNKEKKKPGRVALHNTQGRKQGGREMSCGISVFAGATEGCAKTTATP
eukprot:2734596-Rhodomonas_salina.2